MRLEEMTWEEVNAVDRSTVVIVPFGAMEQHGPHLPLKTDALIGEAIARRLDNFCDGKLLVLPQQWLGFSTHHMRFPGTLTASAETFLALACDTISSIAGAGFSNIIVLNSHGGNAAALDVVLTKCKSLYPSHRLLAVTYWNAAATELAKLRESRIGGMGHACELETSLVLAEQPNLVHMDRARADGRWPASEFLAKDMLRGGSALYARRFDEISDKGAVGDPTTASAAKGEAAFAVIVQTLARLVRQVQSEEIDQSVPVVSAD
ncbi:MAG: creatininase family protein [Acidobacteria bacterium]|nr:creatininase family protein [Acidobacteriota bacterium]